MTSAFSTRAVNGILHALACALVMTLAPAHAAAQGSDIDSNGATVVGPLGLNPKIGWQTEYEDNVYRSSTLPISDFVSTISASTDIRTQVRRVGFTGNASADWMHFASLINERGANLGTSLKVDFLLNRFVPYVSTSYHTSRRRLNPEIDTRPRVEQSSIAAGSAIRVGGKTSLDLSAGHSQVYYERDAMADGVSLGDALNRQSDHFSLSLVQEATPLTRFIVSAERRHDVFEVSSRRTVDYSRFTAGFESDGKVRGYARVGARLHEWSDRSRSDSHGLFALVGTSMTVRDRLQIRIDADRDLAPSYREDITYYESYGYGIGASYAVLRSLRLSGTAHRRVADYSGSSAGATSAPDVEFLNSYGSGISYQLGNFMSVDFSGTYMERTSVFAPRRFNGVSLRAGIVHAF
jgi:hypothetical protein